MGRIMTLPDHLFSPNVIELEDTKDLAQIPFPTGHFQAGDIAHLKSLETLEFSVVYWEYVATNGRRADVELQWALDLFRGAPVTEMRHLVLKIKVGGFLTDSEEALRDFHDAQAEMWRDWKRELALPKWNALKSVDICIWMLSTTDGVSVVFPPGGMVVARARKSLSEAFKGKTCNLHVTYNTVVNHCLVA